MLMLHGGKMDRNLYSTLDCVGPYTRSARLAGRARAVVAITLCQYVYGE